MAASDIGIDLGTRNSLVCTTTRGVILQEPSVVIYDRSEEKIRAIGEEARTMTGHIMTNLEVIWPIHQGVIVDYIVLEKMLKHFISRALGKYAFRKPMISVCVPETITQIGRKALEEAAYQAGARKVYLVSAPIAAALGAGLDVSRPSGNLVVDIGAGTTDAAVISMSGVVTSASIKVGGDNFNQAIMTYVRRSHNLFIGEETAETIKKTIGTAAEEIGVRTMEVRGRNILTGLPKIVTLTSDEMRIALRDCTTQIVELIHSILEKTPPELAADIVDRGIILTGGGALLRSMDTLVQQKTGVSTLTVANAACVTVIGTGMYAKMAANKL